MKKATILIILVILLAGCQQESNNSDKAVSSVVYNGMTHGYSVEEATINGDVIKHDGIIKNISKWDDFMSLVKNNDNASLNITIFIKESVPIINTIEYADGRFDYTAYQQETVIFENLMVKEVIGYTEYVLTNKDESFLLLKILNEED